MEEKRLPISFVVNIKGHVSIWYTPAKLDRDANMDRLRNIPSSLKSKNKTVQGEKKL